MGLLRRDRREARRGGSVRYQMREKLLSIGDDYWIENEGERVFRVDGKALRIRDTFVLEDAHGNEVKAKIQERKLSVPRRDGDRARRRHGGQGAQGAGWDPRPLPHRPGRRRLRAKGSFVDHEYEGWTMTATRLRWCPSAGCGCARPTAWRSEPGEDAALMLAIVVCIDTLSERRD